MRPRGKPSQPPRRRPWTLQASSLGAAAWGAADSIDQVGFRSGDVLVVKANHNPRDGDIVVARLGGEVVVKRSCRTGPEAIELQPESDNPEHKLIRVTPDTVDFEVVGTVVGAVVGTRRDKAQ